MLQLRTVYESLADTTDDGSTGAETRMVLTINVCKSKLINKRFYSILHGMTDSHKLSTF
jgi:hypothetical protein